MIDDFILTVLLFILAMAGLRHLHFRPPGRSRAARRSTPSVDPFGGRAL